MTTIDDIEGRAVMAGGRVYVELPAADFAHLIAIARAGLRVDTALAERGCSERTMVTVLGREVADALEALSAALRGGA